MVDSICKGVRLGDILLQDDSMKLFTTIIEKDKTKKIITKDRVSRAMNYNPRSKPGLNYSQCYRKPGIKKKCKIK